MALEKLQTLTAFLLNQNLVAAEQLDSWMENGRIEASGKNLGQGVRLCYLRYDAVIAIERYAKAPALILALVCAWLQDNDTNREDLELPDPEVDVDIIDETQADLELRLTFMEPVELVADDSGPIPFAGQTWALATVPVSEPDTAAVGDNQAEPTDLPYTREV